MGDGRGRRSRSRRRPPRAAAPQPAESRPRCRPPTGGETPNPGEGSAPAEEVQRLRGSLPAVPGRRLHRRDRQVPGVSYRPTRPPTTRTTRSSGWASATQAGRLRAGRGHVRAGRPRTSRTGTRCPDALYRQGGLAARDRQAKGAAEDLYIGGARGLPAYRQTSTRTPSACPKRAPSSRNVAVNKTDQKKFQKMLMEQRDRLAANARRAMTRRHPPRPRRFLRRDRLGLRRRADSPSWAGCASASAALLQKIEAVAREDRGGHLRHLRAVRRGHRR